MKVVPPERLVFTFSSDALLPNFQIFECVVRDEVDSLFELIENR